MKSITQFRAPNLVAGMNFGILRFQEQYCWMRALMADAIKINMKGKSYGLLHFGNEKSALKLRKIGNELVLSHCLGITKSGQIIGIFEEKTPSISFDLRQKNQSPEDDFDIWIIPEMTESQTIGKPDPEEIPLRQPFAVPKYRLELHPCGRQFSEALRIGRIQKSNGVFQLVNQLPTLAHLGALKLIWERVSQHQSFVDNLYQNSLQILRQRIPTQRPEMIDFYKMVEQVGAFLATKQSAFLMLEKSDSPAKLVQFFNALSGIFQFHLETSRNHAAMLASIGSLVRHASGIHYQPNVFRNAIQEMANLNYQHENLLPALKAINVFAQQIGNVFLAVKEHNPQFQNHFSNQVPMNGTF